MTKIAFRQNHPVLQQPVSLITPPVDRCLAQPYPNWFIHTFNDRCKLSPVRKRPPYVFVTVSLLHSAHYPRANSVQIHMLLLFQYLSKFLGTKSPVYFPEKWVAPVKGLNRRSANIVDCFEANPQ